MKKWLVLMVLGCMMLFSSMAMAADEWPETDGVEVGPDGAGIVDGGAGYWGREAYDPGLDKIGNQSATFNVKMEAFLPCYLEMKITGNDLSKTLQSWDFGKAATESSDNPYIAFYPRASGYVGADWNLKAPGGANANGTNIAPGPEVFIRSCDVIKAELYSNMNYKYSVKIAGGGLTPTAAADSPFTADLLPVQMRYAKDLAFAVDPGTHSFLPTADTAVLANGNNACSAATFYQQFRVPYGREFGAGKYGSRVEFQMISL